MLTHSDQNSLNAIRNALKSGSLPSFPVTPTKRVASEYFTNLWIKDESIQETGTHKDRMAWEIVVTYYSILQAKEKGLHDKSLPSFSIISTGSAALAIQTQLKKYHLPHLKILADIHTPQDIENHLKNIGCDIYKTSLADNPLTSVDILTLTENSDGFDLTSNKALNPDIRFYDWMAYEILNENPEYVFIPYGTGQLYENILNIAKIICADERNNEVYAGDKEKIYSCHFIGATSNNPETLAIKLYAPFRPFTQSAAEWVRLLILQGYCGNKSQVLEVNEEYIKKGNKHMHDFGIASEYSGSSALGLLYQIKEQIPKDEKILVVNTGKAKM